jgi:hypothetical protein
MASANELIERGNKLAEKYDEDQLKAALRDAVLLNDNEERLALQWALKKVTNTNDGYKFTKEQQTEARKRLAIDT